MGVVLRAFADSVYTYEDYKVSRDLRNDEKPWKAFMPLWSVLSTTFEDIGTTHLQANAYVKHFGLGIACRVSVVIALAATAAQSTIVRTGIQTANKPGLELHLAEIPDAMKDNAKKFLDRISQACLAVISLNALVKISQGKRVEGITTLGVYAISHLMDSDRVPECVKNEYFKAERAIVGVADIIFGSFYGKIMGVYQLAAALIPEGYSERCLNFVATSIAKRITTDDGERLEEIKNQIIQVHSWVTVFLNSQRMFGMR